MQSLFRKCLLIQQKMIILGVAQLVSDRKVAGFMPALSINANYLAGILCGVED